MKGSVLSAAIRSLLSEKLTPKQIEELKAEGFNLKNPTRKTVLAIALYKKAATGDLSAIKELRSVLSENAENDLTAVNIIDDTNSKDNRSGGKGI